jgi:hypothetical protein
MKTAIDRLREYRARQDTKPQDMPLPGHLRSGEGSLERRFGPRAAELYPHLGKTVQTPEGGGRLWQVFTVRVGVVLEASPERVTFFGPDEIRPCDDPDGARTGRPVG